MFEGFTPTAKLVNGKSYSIISDYLGTPLQAIDSEGKLIWERELDIYGRICKETKETANFVPMLYQGQYLDTETELVYNYKRYYSQETGAYISQDPIGLNSRVYNLYSYVSDSNLIIDIFGLDWNYVLVNSEGRVYYSGRASDNQTMQDVANRHSKTTGTDGARFGEGDTLQRKTKVGTKKDIVRGVEQRGIEENNLLGRNSDKVRGNKINGISEVKQETTIGRKRLKAADDLLDGKKVSELPTLDELKFKGVCKS